MQYALVTVPPTWDVNTSIGFSEGAYQHWHDKIKPGCRVLVFKPAPVNAFVAEAVVPDNVFQRIDEWPSENRAPVYTGQGQIADYVMPLSVLVSYALPDYVSEERLREAGDLQDISSHEWIPVDVEVYRALRTHPNQEQTSEGG